LAVPLGESSLAVWWISVTSALHPDGSTDNEEEEGGVPFSDAIIESKRGTPTLKLAQMTTGALLLYAVSASIGKSPVVPTIKGRGH
jgi:hypothetical protein